jgi:hypothetical protein
MAKEYHHIDHSSIVAFCNEILWSRNTKKITDPQKH